ncbi:hypothetical protein N7532_010758 [Penicillium argentinense]|uniref:Arrestin-like N-terminal domain-containing protein n=1 Tax=Penicillium argentinense TaxID=1131581 RepID=A0A9W9EQ79_9EURO|nr:uncharacterized protein N7532_010758 [Penicillium argentinense]KAJ5085987.1 hypothetical protein N7532_010758 [Penicillium argentinense]
MPPVPPTGDEHLKLEVAAPPGWSFVAGDTIIGSIVRHAPIRSPDAKVSLALVGRARINPELDDFSEFRSHTCYLLYRVQDALFRGPLHHAQDSEEALNWQFSMQIPSEPDQTVIKEHSGSESFIPLDDPWHPGHHTFPGSFFSSRKHLAFRTEGFIEYYLRARLECIFGGSKRTMDATWPIIMRHPVDESVNLQTLRQISAMRRIKSWSLVPGMKDPKKTIRWSRTPEFYFRVKMSYPEAAQIDNPQTIPVILEIVPDLETSAPLKGTLPRIQVNWVSMVLLSSCHLARERPSALPGMRAHRNEVHEWQYDFGLDRLFKVFDTPLVLSTDEKGYKPFNMGRMFQLALRSDGLVAGTRLLAHPATGIHPDFASHDIKHCNRVQWTVSLTVAGEAEEVTGSGPLKLIAPA